MPRSLPQVPSTVICPECKKPFRVTNRGYIYSHRSKDGSECLGAHARLAYLYDIVEIDATPPKLPTPGEERFAFNRWMGPSKNDILDYQLPYHIGAKLKFSTVVLSYRDMAWDFEGNCLKDEDAEKPES